METINQKVRRDPLATDKEAFAQWVDKLGHTTQHMRNSGMEESAELIEAFGNQAIELIQKLEVVAATPRYENTYGPSYNEKTEVQADEYNLKKVNVHERTVMTQNINIEPDPSLRIYKLSKDLIVATNGQLVLRPNAQKLYTTVGEFELSEFETNRLLTFLKQDYGI